MMTSNPTTSYGRVDQGDWQEQSTVDLGAPKSRSLDTLSSLKRPLEEDTPIFDGTIPKEYCGMARFKDADGSIYDGKFKRGILVKGSMTLKDGIIVTGKFKQRRSYGQCTVTFPNGVSFSGNVDDRGLFGPITFNNGFNYIGELRNFKLHGRQQFPPAIFSL